MDPQLFIDAARYAHILAVATGFGAAFLADIHMLSRMGKPVNDELMTTLHACHSIVWKALAAMWLTGLVLIYVRTGFVIENFSPKLVSKIATVSILTANAFLIGRYAMPIVEASRGGSIMWLSLKTKLLFAAIAAISSASWLFAMAMGVSKVLAASDWIVFGVVGPSIYLLCVGVATGVMFLIHVGSVIAPPAKGNTAADRRGEHLTLRRPVAAA